MKVPFQNGELFLRDVAQHRSSKKLNLWWLGQSGFLVQFGSECLLFDPYLSDSLTLKYAKTNKPHVRLTERVISPEKLDFVNVVTSSHNHTDHLDAETLIPLMRSNPDLQIIVPRANVGFAADRLNVWPERLTPIKVGEKIESGVFSFRAIPAAHEQIETDAAGDHKFIGYIVEVAGFSIYHSGDTVLFDGLIEAINPPIDIAILPINGRDPARGVAGNLSAGEAVQFAQGIGAAVLIPCHFDMFAFNTVSPKEFVSLAKAAGQPFALLQNGERLTLNESMNLSKI